MELKAIKGKLVIDDDKDVLVDNMYVGCRYGGSMYNCLKSYEKQTWTVEKAESPDERVQGDCYVATSNDGAKLTAVFNDLGIFLKSEYQNEQAKYIEPDYNMDLIAVGGVWQGTVGSCLYNSYDKRNGIRVQEMQSKAELSILGAMEEVRSATYVCFEDGEDLGINIGFVTFEKYFSGVHLREDGRFECTLLLDSCLLPEGKKVESDWIHICTAFDANEALADYAATIKAVNDIKLRFDHAPVGFCTWYYYLGDINENVIYDNLKAIDEMKDTVPLEVFQIDDGWGSSHFEDGNHDKFPKGMPYYASLIKEHGLIPGIWLTPFNFGTWEPLVVEHPEYFVHNGDDLVLVQGQAIIDATHPEAYKWIVDMYHKLTYTWGYRYIKLDHVATYICGGKFYDEEAGALQNMRAYFKAMHEGCHPETYIMACTSPMIELAGLVDGVRTSGDIFENWDSLFGVFRRNLVRSFTNGVLYWNDPDCLMLRTAAEEDGDCRRLCSRTFEENRTFATAMYASGGALMISDKLTLASKSMKEDYAKMFPRTGRSGVPLDITTSYMPSIIFIEEEDEKYEDADAFKVAFINWSEKTIDQSFPIGVKMTATDYWDDIELGTYTDKFEITIEPHCSKLVRFVRKED